jgi:hypothetical protein
VAHVGVEHRDFAPNLDSVIQETSQIIEVAAGSMTAQVLTQQGPRILGLVVDGIGQLLGRTQMVLEGPLGPVPVVGGHRLWSAPELRTTTYVPDTRVRISELTDGVKVVSDDSRLHIEKAIEVRAAGESLVIDHLLTNRSGHPIEVAVWAITMIRPGGTFLMPAPLRGLDEEGLQARFSVILWPYTDMGDSRLKLSDDGVLMRVEGTKPIKAGTPNLRGWAAYLIDGIAFVKWTRRFDPNDRYADLGAGMQAFVGHGFGELETLGPLTALHSGASVTHREVWELHRVPQDSSAFEALEALNLPEDHRLLLG